MNAKGVSFIFLMLKSVCVCVDGFYIRRGLRFAGTKWVLL